MERPEWKLTGDTWDEWKAFLAALFAIPMTGEQWEVFREFTGRETPPDKPPREAWMIVGRRGGKSRIAALIATYLACYRDYTPYLAPGERATIPIISKDMKEAFVILRYIKGWCNSIPYLRDFQTHEPAGKTVELNNVVIEVMANSFRSVRGFTVVNVLCDEIAYWMSDETSVNPDIEVLRALRPSMLTIPNALMLGLSSPYGRKGVLWEAFKDHYGKDGDRVLVWKGSTEAMNPSADPDEIADAYEKDDIAAAAEYGAEFRTDVAGYIQSEALDAVIVADRKELAPVHKQMYWSFCDPSGGSVDSMVLAIGHKDPDHTLVLDCIREKRARFNTNEVTKEFAELLRRYNIGTVHGDKYGGEWPRDEFRANLITYIAADKTKSDYYVEFLALVNSGRMKLLDNKRLRNQILALERKVSRAGKDSVDHPPGGHDDVANAVAGLMAYIAKGPAWHNIDLGDTPLEDPTEGKHPYQRQLIGGLGESTLIRGRDKCKNCVNYRDLNDDYQKKYGAGYCKFLEQRVKREDPQCLEGFEKIR